MTTEIQVWTHLDPNGDAHRVARELGPAILANDNLAFPPAEKVRPFLARPVGTDLHPLDAVAAVGEDDGHAVRVLVVAHADPAKTALVIRVLRCERARVSREASHTRRKRQHAHVTELAVREPPTGADEIVKLRHGLEEEIKVSF